MGTKMKLLFEGWRKYINEAEESPEEILRHRFDQEAYDQAPKEQWAVDSEKAEELIEKYSLNSGQSSQHRWGRGLPIVDYDIDAEGGELHFNATIQIQPPAMTQRNFGEEVDLEKRVHQVLESTGLGKTQGLKRVNIMTEPHSSIQIEYWPEAPGIENLEPFLKHITEIAARFQELRITDQLYKQQELPLQTDPKKEFRDRIRRLGSGRGRTPYADEDLARAKGEL